MLALRLSQDDSIQSCLAQNWKASQIGAAQIGIGWGIPNVTTTGNWLFSLDGRVALITGASRGLGLAMAEGLAEVGSTVVLNGRHADTLEATAGKLRARGLKAECLPFDVTDRGAAAAAFESIAARHGRLDILVANAGIHHRALLADWTPENGIVIAPECVERRQEKLWYYTWDCSSGCIWSPNAVEAWKPL